MSVKDMQEIWTRIEIWLQANAPEIFDAIQVGASDAQIEELAEVLSVDLPEDFKSLYRICNGQLDYSYGAIEGRELLSLDRIKEEWIVWKELIDCGDFKDENGKDQGCDPDPGIQNVWMSEKWIPLTWDGAGNHYCLDLDPAEGGTFGQIITMCHDAPYREIIAPSLRDWLTQYAAGLESGKFILSEEYGIIEADSI